jgi:hypothetical protein
MTQNISASPSKAGKVTVLVFKDNYASRTFQIPLHWFSKLGITLWALIILCLIVSFLAVKYYWIAKKSDTSRVSDLEQQISDLKTSYQASLAQAQAQVQNQIHQNQMPVPTVTVTVVPSMSTAAAPPVQVPAPTAASTNVLLFRALPSAVSAHLLDSEAVSIRMTNPRTSWAGKSLNVHFDIQYVKNDHKNQQGRIVILARGPGTLFSYPINSFNRTEKEALINPNMGEYFSVSRFREVKATIGPMAPFAEPFSEVELLLFSINGELLIYKKLDVPKFTGTIVRPKVVVPVETPPAQTDSTESQSSQSEEHKQPTEGRTE